MCFDGNGDVKFFGVWSFACATVRENDLNSTCGVSNVGKKKSYYKKRTVKTVKVEVFWEGHKIWKKSSNCFDIYTVTSKQLGDFFPKFVASLECLNFNNLKIICKFCQIKNSKCRQIWQLLLLVNTFTDLISAMELQNLMPM